MKGVRLNFHIARSKPCFMWNKHKLSGTLCGAQWKQCSETFLFVLLSFYCHTVEKSNIGNRICLIIHVIYVKNILFINCHNFFPHNFVAILYSKRQEKTSRTISVVVLHFLVTHCLLLCVYVAFETSQNGLYLQKQETIKGQICGLAVTLLSACY